ncbi:malonyl-ACP O-methyltransferase BioC [Thioflexithrix psekupsensis]|uniref:malonyl-ACP O-methyltransferase BioC n=1 Tax=Thioflexithrix psekupsensis TaxID=1570016 RepID=UPI001C3D218D|nr:malonyl-ACP O-methyltransferase BioC [Thioflexithrix psekupsensis]
MSLVSPDFLARDKVAQSFGRMAAQYEQHAQLQQFIGDFLLERLHDIKINPQRIVDLGSGSGWLSRKLTARYPKATCYSLDVALPMLQQAQQKRPVSFWPFSRPRQFLICADAMQLPLADHSIDLLVSNLMLQWCNDFAPIFQEIARVLKPDGILLFTSFGPDTLRELRQSWATVDNYSHVNRFIDMHDLGDALLRSGFTHPVMDTDWLYYHYPDVKSILRSLKNIGAHNIMQGRLKTLTGKNRFQQMIQAYETLRQQQGLPVTYEVIYGHAVGQSVKHSAKPSQNESSPHLVNVPISAIGRIKKA